MAFSPGKMYAVGIRVLLHLVPPLCERPPVGDALVGAHRLEHGPILEPIREIEEHLVELIGDELQRVVTPLAVIGKNCMDGLVGEVVLHVFAIEEGIDSHEWHFCVPSEDAGKLGLLRSRVLCNIANKAS